jgi:hypothetical protein
MLGAGQALGSVLFPFDSGTLAARYRVNADPPPERP